MTGSNGRIRCGVTVDDQHWRCALSVGALLAWVLSAAAAGESGEWRSATWNGEAAWTAAEGGWIAVVSPSRGRLVEIRHPASGTVVLRAPERLVPVGAAWLGGGHQVWLGPQERWQWPPPAVWEGAAASAEVVQHDLVLRLPAGPDAPALERRYAWQRGELRCTVAWRDLRPWCALHVLRVDGGVAAPVRIEPNADAPHGFAIRDCSDGSPSTSRFAWPQPGIEPVGDLLRLVSMPRRKWKAYLPLQPLTVAVAGGAMRMRAGPVVGRVVGESDHGLTSQVYLAPSEAGYIEIEQVSPLLLPLADGGDAVATLLIRPYLIGADPPADP